LQTKWTEKLSSNRLARKKKRLPTKVFAKAGQTEAVVQQFQHHWAVVQAGQATFG